MKSEQQRLEELHERLARLAVTCVVAGKFDPMDVTDGLLLAIAAVLGGVMTAAEAAHVVERKAAVLVREMLARDAPGSAAMH